MIIALAGFMGCGKSSVGSIVNSLTGCTFIDLDDYIEKKSGRMIREIFASEGEQAFRKMEEAALSEVTGTYSGKDDKLLLALGGGSLTVANCARLVKENTFCIYLRGTISTLADNLKGSSENRPILRYAKGDELIKRIGELMDERSAIYENAADRIIDIDGRGCLDIAEEIALLFRS